MNSKLLDISRGGVAMLTARAGGTASRSALRWERPLERHLRLRMPPALRVAQALLLAGEVFSSLVLEGRPRAEASGAVTPESSFCRPGSAGDRRHRTGGTQRALAHVHRYPASITIFRDSISAGIPETLLCHNGVFLADHETLGHMIWVKPRMKRHHIRR